LQNNHFEYYLKHQAGLKEHTDQIKEEFSGKLLGIIIHDIITTVWNELIVSNSGLLFGYNFDIPEKIIHKAIDRILSSPDYYLRLPHNYALIYFDKILRFFIVQAVKIFFTQLANLNLDKKKIDVFPEKEYSTAEEQEYKILLNAGENPGGFTVRIKGRADLRIEVPEEKHHYIFDYKTGTYQDEQLLFYELFYYLLEDPTLQVDSLFVDVFNNKLKKINYRKKSKSELLFTLQQNIVEHLTHIYQNGFDLQKKPVGWFPEITRADVYQLNKDKL
ncbi:PD-(D/E)XK nuclease family protein, partial [candidate division KSB1 bacterium]|nr:PD-(D/E)XK nuclease family protein [candidate division KSB1 bacterium]